MREPKPNESDRQFKVHKDIIPGVPGILEMVARAPIRMSQELHEWNLIHQRDAKRPIH